MYRLISSRRPHFTSNAIQRSSNPSRRSPTSSGHSDMEVVLDANAPERGDAPRRFLTARTGLDSRTRISMNKPVFPPIQQMPAAAEAAIERDKTWFRDNPDKARRRRRVRWRELPASLRDLDIAEVVIERAGPRHFIRTFLDPRGRPVASGGDIYHTPVVPEAPEGTISMSQRGECFVGKTGYSAAEEALAALRHADG